jgi:hypothetical protein
MFYFFVVSRSSGVPPVKDTDGELERHIFRMLQCNG